MKNMKKLLVGIVTLALAGVASAHCPNNAQKIVDRVKSHPQVTAINITYSPDNATWATTLKDQMTPLDSTLTINLVPTDGTGVCEIARA